MFDPLASFIISGIDLKKTISLSALGQLVAVRIIRIEPPAPSGSISG